MIESNNASGIEVVMNKRKIAIAFSGPYRKNVVSLSRHDVKFPPLGRAWSGH